MSAPGGVQPLLTSQLQLLFAPRCALAGE